MSRQKRAFVTVSATPDIRTLFRASMRHALHVDPKEPERNTYHELLDQISSHAKIAEATGLPIPIVASLRATANNINQRIAQLAMPNDTRVYCNITALQCALQAQCDDWDINL